MKVVVLLAGKGRRLNGEHGDIHKALSPVNGKPALSYLLNNIKKTDIEEIIPVLGYKGEEVLECIKKYASSLKITPVWNEQYETTNNLYSLLQVQNAVAGKDFIQINGDMVFDYRILLKILEVKGSAVAVDVKEYSKEVDSPKVLIKNGRILDLKVRSPLEGSNGYAVGIYRFSKELAGEFFARSKMLVKDNPNMSFPEALQKLLEEQFVMPCTVEDYLWMDIDRKSDIAQAEDYIERFSENPSVN